MLLLSAPHARVCGTRRIAAALPHVARFSTTRPAMQLREDEVDAMARAAALKIAIKLVMPPRLSPTAVTAFKECPQTFLFQNMWKLPEPPSKALEKGSVVHDTLEKLFDLPPAERRDQLHHTLRKAWRERRNDALVTSLFGEIVETRKAGEREWGQECLHLLDNYLAFEDPAAPPTGEPLAREAWASAILAAADGVVPELKMVGRIDRLDCCGEGGITIVDYKTGREFVVIFVLVTFLHSLCTS